MMFLYMERLKKNTIKLTCNSTTLPKERQKPESKKKLAVCQTEVYYCRDKILVKILKPDRPKIKTISAIHPLYESQ